MLNASKNLSLFWKIQRVLIFGWFLTITLVACGTTQKSEKIDAAVTARVTNTSAASTVNSITPAITILDTTTNPPTLGPITNSKTSVSPLTTKSTITQVAVSSTQCSYTTPLPVQTISTSNYDNGIPAINPQTKSTDPLVPSFTASEVIKYIQGRRALGRLIFDTSATVDKVDFLTSNALNVKLCHYLGLNVPDDTLLCYVELSGNFENSLPPNPTNPKGTIIKTSHALAVFDAHSGNLLLVG